MSTEATPTALDNGGTPPAEPVAPPSTPPAETPPAPTPATVTLTKEEHDKLVGRATGNQRKADLYDRHVGKNGRGHFSPGAPATPPTQEELAASGAEEDRKAERGLVAIAADPAFRTALDADPTLRDLFIKNPLAVLPILAPDALDADDALTLVKDALKERTPAAPATPPATPPVPPTNPPPAPPAGGINPQAAAPVDEEYESHRKNPNTENALAGMIGNKLKRMGGSS